MFVGSAVAFPLVLMALMLVMERVERPLRVEQMTRELQRYLDTAPAEEVEEFVAEGMTPAIERYWRRRRRSEAARARRGSHRAA